MVCLSYQNKKRFQNLFKSKAETNRSPLTSVFVLPASDRILQANQSRCIWSLSPFIFDEPLHDGPVTAHFAEQVIKQRGFSQRAGEQLLGRVRFPSYLPDHGFDREHEFALQAEPGMFLFRFVWLNQIYPAIGTTQ